MSVVIFCSFTRVEMINDLFRSRGGPGVIMSRETLRRVAPHIPVCLKNLYSTHEDVEVGRCVQKFAGIPCTWNYEVRTSLVMPPVDSD